MGVVEKVFFIRWDIGIWIVITTYDLGICVPSRNEIPEDRLVPLPLSLERPVKAT